MVASVRDLALGPPAQHARRLRPAAGARVARARLHAAATACRSISTSTGDLDSLPDQHRTCVYRVVQEALTNCVRHAQRQPRSRSRVRCARRRARSRRSPTTASASIRRRDATGFGLRGIEERVRELDGTFTIASASRRTGATLTLPLPLRAHGGRACACCWLTITPSSGAACAACSRPSRDSTVVGGSGRWSRGAAAVRRARARRR